MDKKDKNWYIFDFDGQVLGRGASEIAQILVGKHKPSFRPNIDCGDYVIVVNASKFVLTGNKSQTKRYFKHTGYLGNIKERDLSDLEPEDVIKKTVRGMLPKNKLLSGRMERLKVYAGEEHAHQNIKDIKELNS